MPVNAFTATAASMLRNGDSPEHVRHTLGLSEAELAEALQHTNLPAPATADTGHSASTPQAATAPAPGSTTDPDKIEALLTWAENHPAASIRNRAARIRADLTELDERRVTDAAQHAAQERVANANAELEAAQAQLRKVKAGGRTATEDPATTTPSVLPREAGGKRSKEELAAIRTWARANGHQIADRGTPAKAVLDAYDAAHRTTNPAQAN